MAPRASKRFREPTDSARFDQRTTEENTPEPGATSRVKNRNAQHAKSIAFQVQTRGLAVSPTPTSHGNENARTLQTRQKIRNAIANCQLQYYPKQK